MIESSSRGVQDAPLEPVIGLAEGETRWRGMTTGSVARSRPSLRANGSRECAPDENWTRFYIHMHTFIMYQGTRQPNKPRRLSFRSQQGKASDRAPGHVRPHRTMALIRKSTELIYSGFRGPLSGKPRQSSGRVSNSHGKTEATETKRSPDRNRLSRLRRHRLSGDQATEQAGPQNIRRALYEMFWQRAAGKARPLAAMIRIGNQTVQSRITTHELWRIHQR
jgi:hypothetical protein